MCARYFFLSKRFQGFFCGITRVLKTSFSFGQNEEKLARVLWHHVVVVVVVFLKYKNYSSVPKVVAQCFRYGQVFTVRCSCYFSLLGYPLHGVHVLQGIQL